MIRTEIFCDICAVLGVAAGEVRKMPAGWKTFKLGDGNGYAEIREIEICDRCLGKIAERRGEAAKQGWGN